jgi:hypothetical protein
MLFRLNRHLLLCVVIVAALIFPAMAQQSLPHSLLCDAFTKTANGDWVAERDVMVPGLDGMAQLKAGQAVDAEMDEELQERLDEQCK